MPGGAWPGHRRDPGGGRDRLRGDAEIGGKPERHLFELARALIAGAERVAMVGDRIASDIEGGHAGRPGDDPRPQRRRLARGGRGRPTPPPGPRRRRPRRRCCGERAGRQRRAARPRPGVAFAGVFAVTFCGLVAVGAVLPVLPRYVHGPLDAGNIAVGIVIGSYAITGLLLRPFAGRLADRRGRKPTVLVGSILVARRRLPLPAAARGRRA